MPVTIKWTMHNRHGSGTSQIDAVAAVLRDGTITKSSAAHFTVKTGSFTIVFDGDFTGNPVSQGTITGFHLFQGNVVTLDASGYNLDFHDFLQGVQNAAGDGFALLSLLEQGPMNIVGSSQSDLLLGGNFSDVITGGKGDDVLIGIGGKDTLIGGKGNDVLYAGSGKDKLTGGSGDDTFHFHNLDGVGVVTDFQVGHDHFELNKHEFTAFGHSGTVKSGEFHIGTHAADGNDYLIYDKNTGALYYDSDGAGGADQIKFGKVDAHLNLSHNDFSLVTPLL